MASFVTDTFTDTAGTNLDSHTSDSGATWSAAIEAASTDSIKVDSSDRIRCSAIVATYYASVSPTTADYDVSADISYLSAVTNATAGVSGRMSTTANTQYFARFNSSSNDQWELYAVVNGTADFASGYTQIGNSRSNLLQIGNTSNIKLSMRGTTIALIVDGTTLISVTDSSITAAGQAGVRFDIAQADGTGIVIDNFIAANPIVADGTIPVNDPNLRFSPLNWFVSGLTYAITNTPGAKLSAGFTGTSLSLGIDVSAWGAANISSSQYPGLIYSIDGATLQTVQPSVGATSIALATGLAAGNHTLELWWQSFYAIGDRWNTPVLAVKVTGLIVDSGAQSASPIPPRAKLLLVYGDSYSEGQRINGGTDINSNVDATAAFGTYVAEALNADLALRGIGGGGWVQNNSGNTPPMFTPGNDTSSCWDKYFAGQSLLSGGLYTTQPNYILTEYGVNDYGQTDAAVTASVSGWLSAVRTAAPNAKVFVCIPFSRVKATAILSGVSSYAGGTVSKILDDMTLYTGSTDKNVFVIDMGTNIAVDISTVDTPSGATETTNDGLHPTKLVQSKAAAKMVRAITSLLNAGGGPNSTTLTVTSNGTTPISGANCWITSDSAGVNPITGILQSDSSGHVTFNLTTGTTYYIWSEASGYRAAGVSFTA